MNGMTCLVILATIVFLIVPILAIPEFYFVPEGAAPNGSSLRNDVELDECLERCALNSSCYGVGFSDSQCFLNFVDTVFVLNVSTSDYYQASRNSSGMCSNAPSLDSPCNSGWTYMPPVTTSPVGCAAVIPGPITFDEASLQCQEGGAEVASAGSAKRAMRMAYIYSVSVISYFYLGAAVIDTTATQMGIRTANDFRWLDGNLWNYTLFAPGEPKQSVAANCLALKTDYGVAYNASNPDITYPMYWYTFPCNTTLQGAVCQTPPNFIYQT